MQLYKDWPSIYSLISYKTTKNFYSVRKSNLKIFFLNFFRFAHCINLEYYEDLVRLLDKLMTDGNLKTKEQLNCILTVFKILSGQGEALCIDPNKFYSHLYANMFNVDLGLYCYILKFI